MGSADVDVAFRKDSTYVVHQLLSAEKDFRNSLFSFIHLPSGDGSKPVKMTETGNHASFAEQWAAKKRFESPSTRVDRKFRPIQVNSGARSAIPSPGANLARNALSPPKTTDRNGQPTMSKSGLQFPTQEAVILDSFTTPSRSRATATSTMKSAGNMKKEPERTKTTPLNAVLRQATSPPISTRVSFADSVEERSIDRPEIKTMHPESVERKLFEQRDAPRNAYSMPPRDQTFLPRQPPLFMDNGSQSVNPTPLAVPYSRHSSPAPGRPLAPPTVLV